MVTIYPRIPARAGNAARMHAFRGRGKGERGKRWGLLVLLTGYADRED
jgi:hypothetical protein